MSEYTNCSNCSYALSSTDKFCGNCGQDTHSTKMPFKHFVMELLEGIFHFDTKIWYTLKQLFKSPGLVVKTFNENKRMRFVPPVRLYIFVSVLFFLLISGGVKEGAHTADVKMRNQMASGPFRISTLSTANVDSLTIAKMIAIPNITDAQVDSALTSAHVKTNMLNNRLIKQFIHLKRGETTLEEISHTFLASISKVLFLLMPLFAFLVWLVCGRKKLYYAETLVFSLYYHAFYFILLLLSVLLSYVVEIKNINGYVYLLACVYLVTSVKFAFSKSWSKAFFLSFLLMALYSILCGMVFILAIIGSFVF